MKQRLETEWILRIYELVLDGLYCDGGHHKQWYLEQILVVLGMDLDNVKHRMLRAGNDEWEPGVAP